jgi:hypothetical protein
VHHRVFDILLGDPARNWRHRCGPPHKEQGREAAGNYPSEAVVRLGELAEEELRKGDGRGSGFGYLIVACSLARRADYAWPDGALGPAGRAVKDYSFHLRSHLFEPTFQITCKKIFTPAAKTSCAVANSKNFGNERSI